MENSDRRIDLIVAALFLAALWLLAPMAEAKETSSIGREVQTIVELSRAAASKQAEGLAVGEATNVGLLPHGAMGRSKFGEVQLIYRAVLKMLRGMSPADLEGQKWVLSRVYSQVGWFVYMTRAEPSLEVDGVELIRKAHELDPGNAVVLYQLGKIKLDRKEPDAEMTMIRYCSEAVKVDPEFPEAWFHLSLNHLRKGDQAAWKETRERFLATLSRYKPELHYFDTGYPPVNERILMEGGVELERKAYNTDSARFRIRVKQP